AGPAGGSLQLSTTGSLLPSAEEPLVYCSVFSVKGIITKQVKPVLVFGSPSTMTSDNSLTVSFCCVVAPEVRGSAPDSSPTNLQFSRNRRENSSWYLL